MAEAGHFTRAAHCGAPDPIEPVELDPRAGAGAPQRPVRTQHPPRRLTDAGRALLPAARRAVAAAEDGRDAVAGVRGLVRGQLAIGVIHTQSLGCVDFPALVARYHRRHPAVTVRLHHAGVASLVHHTADGELELAIVDLPLGPQAGRVTARPIGTESLQLGVAAPDPLAHRNRVRLSDLADRDFVEYRADSSLRASIDRACEAAGLRRRIACEVDTMADLVELVALGLGVSLLPPAAIRMAGDARSGSPATRRYGATSASSRRSTATPRQPARRSSKCSTPTH